MTDGANVHRVVLEFDGGGIRAKLICPESGCTPGQTCGLCGRDYGDPESTPCYDCKDAKLDECWIKTWFDNESADELLHGQVELEIEGEWDGDHMKAIIVPRRVTADA